MPRHIKIDSIKTLLRAFASSPLRLRGQLEIRDESEKKALLDLCQSIDNELVETFRESYLNWSTRERE